MIKAGDELVTYELGASVEVGLITPCDIQLTIRGQFFSSSDIKELRKFLKKLQRQLEGNDKDDFGGVSI